MNGLLRGSLTINALFSLTCAGIGLVYAEPLGLGLAAPVVVVEGVAGMLGVFAIGVAALAWTRATRWAGLVIALDLAWVLGTDLMLLLHHVPSPALVIGPALAVFALAIAQLAGLWRMRRVEIRRSVEIQAPPEAAWEILGERFGDVGEWAAPILASSMDADPAVGSLRTCVVGGFGPVSAGRVHERLIEWDRDAMVLEYVAIAGMPPFIVHASNRWSVHPTANGCEVRSHATLDVRWPMALLADALVWKFGSDGRLVLEDLRHRVEQGRPHPRKLALVSAEPASNGRVALP